MEIINNYIKLTDYSLDEQVKLIKNFYIERNLDPYMLKTTVAEFLNIIKSPPFAYDLDDHTNSTLIDTIFQFGSHPREYSYDVEYIKHAGTSQEDYFYQDKRKFFEATKIFYFLKNPLSEFRTPFHLVNTPFTKKNSIHGLFRTMMLPFITSNLELNLIMFDKNLVEFSKNKFTSCLRLLSLTNEELIDKLKLEIFSDSELYMFYSDELGAQLIEPHSTMSEFKTNWTVKFDGVDLLVNDVVVAKLTGTTFSVINEK